MPFVKGDERINRTGRPKGSLNKKTHIINYLLNEMSKPKRERELKHTQLIDVFRMYTMITPKETRELGERDITYISTIPREKPATEHPTTNRALSTNEPNAVYNAVKSNQEPAPSDEWQPISDGEGDKSNIKSNNNVGKGTTNPDAPKELLNEE